MKFTTEMLEKAKTAKTAEELLELAKAENVEMTAEEAAKYFAEFNKTGELSDEELDNVAGGCTQLSPTGQASNPAEVKYLYYIGKYVEIFVSGREGIKPYEEGRSGCSCTVAANIIDRKIDYYDGYYYPKYKIRYKKSQGEGWVWQNEIQD